jgi:uncharacterized membrane protein YkgB
VEQFSRRGVVRPTIHEAKAVRSSIAMYSVFYIIGVVVVVLAILSLLGLD